MAGDAPLHGLKLCQSLPFRNSSLNQVGTKLTAQCCQRARTKQDVKANSHVFQYRKIRPVWKSSSDIVGLQIPDEERELGPAIFDATPAL